MNKVYIILTIKLLFSSVSLAVTNTTANSKLGITSKSHLLSQEIIPSSCVLNPTSKFVLNVRSKGAKGDGITNDTKAIQRAIDQVGGSGGTVLIPKGEYLIDAIAHLQLKSKMTLKLENGAILKAIPNDKQSFAVIEIQNIFNVNIIGGVVEGERTKHQGKEGEWGHGIDILNAKNITINGLTSKNNWGDGFYVGNQSSNVALCSVVADNNRRQGLSITSVNGMLVKDSIFKNTNGTAPEAGLDIEPNTKELVTNVQVRNSQFLNNFGAGFEIAGKSDDGSESSHITMSNNTVTSNGVNRHAGILLSHAFNTVVENNVVKNNLRQGIDMEDGTIENIVKGNTINDNLGLGIEMYEVKNNVISNNKISNNGKHAIKVYKAPKNIITNNIGENNESKIIYEYPVGSNIIKDNFLN